MIAIVHTLLLMKCESNTFLRYCVLFYYHLKRNNYVVVVGWLCLCHVCYFCCKFGSFELNATMILPHTHTYYNFFFVAS